mmetsp:Transcript_41605/g.94855  ORF Transcript_41605/g.94855 Transcript_41605/m.94855 type:complete len:212 (-) Transcript_41605:180-815(-)
MAARAVYSGPPGQDPSEQFRLCAAPPAGHGGFADEVVLLEGRKARALVHRDGDWHRSVHLWLYHPASKSVVLQQRSVHKDTHPGLWDVSAAGHITGDDDVVTTVVREAEEELGLTGLSHTDVRFLFTAVNQSVGETKHGAFRDNEFAHVYTAEAPDIDKLSAGESEVSAIKMVPLLDLRDALTRKENWLVPKGIGYVSRLVELLTPQAGPS